MATAGSIQIARKLRKQSTDAERMIWFKLRARQILGLKFRRQEPIGEYIVDFVCLEKRIIIEIDGGQHDVLRAQDKKRDSELISQGFQVLRFWNNEVIDNIEGVMGKICEVCEGTLPRPLPSKGRG